MKFSSFHASIRLFTIGVRSIYAMSTSTFCRVYESREEIILVTFLAIMAWLALLLYSMDAYGQDKWYSTPSRGVAEGARQNAQLTTLQNETGRMNACTAAGLVYAPTHAEADAGGCVTNAAGRNLSGDLAVGGNASISGTLSVGGDVLISGGLKLGDTSTCDPTSEGTIRYLPSQKSIMLCDGASWIEVGASPTTAGAFVPVNDAALSTTITSNTVGVSGFFGTRTATVTNGASIVVNGVTQGSTANVEAGDSIQLRMSSAGTYGTTRSTSFNLSTLSATWVVTTGTVNYGSWGAWGSCSQTCGGGTQTRTRPCNFSGGGTVTCSACGGDCTQTQSCNLQACCTPGPAYVYTSSTSYTDACGVSYVNATNGKCWGNGGQVDSSCIINASTWRRNGGSSADAAQYCQASGAFLGGGTGWTSAPCLKRLRRP